VIAPLFSGGVTTPRSPWRTLVTRTPKKSQRKNVEESRPEISTFTLIGEYTVHSANSSSLQEGEYDIRN